MTGIPASVLARTRARPAHNHTNGDHPGPIDVGWTGCPFDRSFTTSGRIRLRSTCLVDWITQRRLEEETAGALPGEHLIRLKPYSTPCRRQCKKKGSPSRNNGAANPGRSAGCLAAPYSGAGPVRIWRPRWSAFERRTQPLQPAHLVAPNSARNAL